MAEADTQSLVGQTLVDVRGDKVGTIDELLIHGDGQEHNWATVKYGLLGMHRTHVPLQHAVREEGRVRVPYETEVIREAPAVTPRDGRIGDEEASELHRHFGLEPLEAQSRVLDDEELDPPRETRDAVPPAMEEGPDSPLAKRRRERARELGVPDHD
jgi:hypothetical protein